ncbi:SDR family oxidoreductase [Cohnella endophytica]|uniref:SDR family oxidoreductase n=1 Tax=Cohnella endophytica TaxID=2419778 RepID=A0A494Y4P2_9BACL|nr:3-oxoacyl-ACP reductase FabG [Cohnella endophytica]RKP55521.1 SDR family oxidoreductase [Cohnella endophytica]
MKRVALVTGASRGIGAAVARQLAADGADVAIQYFAAAEAAEAVASECRGHGVQAVVLRADLRATASAATLKQRLDELGWAPNIVVHCAGIAHYGLIDDTEESIWDNVMNVNLKGAFELVRAFSPAMRWQRWGRIVLLSSIWGSVGASGEAAYAASKGGLNAFAKSAAKELASSGLTVNAVSPGAVDTDMLAALNAEDRETLCREIPLGRLGQVAEIAQLVRYLASDSAGYVTGQTIGINGGWHM